jgi:hypothetical protein
MEDAIARQFSEIRRVEISEEEIGTFVHEADFVGKSVDMLIEAGSFLTVCTQIFPSGESGWVRNEAILGGHLVRLYKLIHVILDQSCQNRRESAFIASRLHFETVVNFFFLTDRYSEEAMDDFALYSLQHEVRLIDRIRQNIADRNGKVLPIEDRMLRSISKTFDRADATEQGAREWKKGPWSRLNLFERAKAVGLDEAYLAVFGGGSLIVHGNWSDFDQHHLRYDEGERRFKPEIKFRPIRPQFLEVNCLTSIRTVVRVFEHYGLINLRAMVVHLCDDYLRRLRLLSDRHETFLQSRP